MDIRKLFWSCLFAFHVLSVFAADLICSEGTVLFREDFGGNSVSDPPLGPELPAGAVSLHFSEHQWSKLKNGYDIRKEAIKRAGNGTNHVYSGWYADFGDHTHENDLTRGYFMVIDLDRINATFYNTKVTNLCENTNLTFSFWGRSLNASADAPVSITIEDTRGNVLAKKEFILSSKVYAWTQFSLPFSVPEGETSVIYRVYSGDGTGNGGDLALDDIEVRLCKAPVEVNKPDDKLCLGSDFTLKATFDNTDLSYVEPLTYTWYKNNEKNYNEEGWTKIATGATLPLKNLSEADEGYYKVFVSSAGVPGDFNMCNSSSDIVEIKLEACECIPTDTIIKDSICAGGSYSFENDLLTEAGTYKYKLLNAAGCDSLVTLMLTVLPQSLEHVIATVSLGEDYKENGFDLPKQTEVGKFTHKITLTDQYGCDSIVDLTLTVTPCSVPTEDVEDSICRGQSYSWGTRELTEAGVYMLNGKTQNGCDSLVKLTLSVLPLSLEYVAASVSLGEDYKENGFDLPKQTEIGTFMHEIILTNQYGCDSTVKLFLDVTPCSFTENVSASICQGESYSFDGKALTEAGTYEAHLLTANGCDSLVTLKLTVVEKKEKNLEESICQGQSYSFDGKALTEAGTYEAHLLTANGCDSLVTLKLTVVEKKEKNLEESICQGQSYSFDGKTLTEAGTYEAHLLTANGCDSLVTLKLTVVEKKEKNLEESICQGQSYSFDGKALTEAGTYEAHLLTANGCDSLVTLKLTVVEKKEKNLEESICQGQSYSFDGKTLTEAGTYEAHLLTDDGCDSLVTLKLTVVEKKEKNLEESICQGQNYSFDGKALTEAGTYEAHLLTEAGCDSLVTLKLTVLEKKETTLEETICKGENFTFGGKLLTEAGTYEDHLLSQSGCDSLVTLKLTVLEKVETEIEESICEGESYTFNGKTLTDTGIYEELLTSTVGCDSLVKLKLTILRKSYVTISDTIKLSRIYKKNGFDIDNAQIGENIFEKTWHNHWGCDSIVTLILYVESRAFDTTYISICEGEELTWRGIDCSSAGKYETTTTTADSEMDSLHVLIVNHYPKLELDERYEMKVCYGTTTEFSEICSDDYTFQWTPSDNLSSTSVCNPKIQAKVDSIQYKVYVSNERCRDSFLVDVYASEGPSIQETNYDVQSDEYTVVAIGGEPEYTYSWEDGPWQTTAEYQKKYTPKPTLVRVRDSHGCEAKSYAAIYLPIIPAEYMSPNGDGIRDTWEIKNLTYYSTYTVKIYDRYGKLLIKYVNEYPGWDGIYMGVRMPSTDYWYTISVDEIDKEYVGHFTLLR